MPGLDVDALYDCYAAPEVWDRFDPDVMTLSIHGAHNFPFRKQRSKIDVELPETPNRRWYRVIDTSLPPEQDIVAEEEAYFLGEAEYTVRPRSTIVLIAR